MPNFLESVNFTILDPVPVIGTQYSEGRVLAVMLLVAASAITWLVSLQWV